jgi:hypothetical protein
MKFLIVQLPPFSRHLIPLRSEYSSQNPVLILFVSIETNGKCLPATESMYHITDIILCSRNNDIHRISEKLLTVLMHRLKLT